MISIDGIVQLIITGQSSGPVASPRLQQFAELLRASGAVAIVSARSACADATTESGSKRVLWRTLFDAVFTIFSHWSLEVKSEKLPHCLEH